MDKDYPKLVEVALGAMLHDIGKFAQRTGQKQYRSTYEELLCPYQSKKNYFSHRHVLYTDGFLTAYKQIFPNDLNSGFIVNLAAKHHKPDTPFEWMVAVADWLSSGTDRMARQPDEESETYYTQPLKSIFSKAQFGDNPVAESVYQELKKLSPQTIFPQHNVEYGYDKYENLWIDFENDIKKLQERNYKINDFFILLDNILQHYTWSIPSSTRDEPDISLYDHLRITAALAAVIYRFHEEHDSLEKPDEIKNKESKKFLFVSGDLSGIQDYIFKSSDTKAKILRAKSFEIQAFSETVARYILEKLDLPPVCKIMDAGGRFLLLLPNTVQTRNILEKTREEVEEWVVHKYFGELTLNLSSGVEASGNDLDQARAPLLFAAIAEDTTRAKQTKLQKWLNNNSHLIDREYNRIKSNQDVCTCCGKRVKKPGSDLCPICFSQDKFGERIPKNNYLAYIDDKEEAGLNLLYDYSLKSYADLREIHEYTLPISINRFDALFASIYTPYYLPMDEKGNVLDFEHIAAKAEGKNYLAMLKADVDNLGYIFSSGMGDKISLSRYASLSRMLNFFFSAFINNRLKTDCPNLYTIFSGGDDLCLIGPWNEILDFVSDLQDDFTRYTGNNPSISISCGIALAGAKLPVRNMAENAENALSEAKKDKPGKIHVLHTTANKEEFKRLLEAANKLSSYMREKENKRVSSQVVYRLLDYGRQKKEFESGNLSKKVALWRSHFVYDTARNINGSFVDEFRRFAMNHIDNMNFVASYALYKNRKQEDNL